MRLIMISLLCAMNLYTGNVLAQDTRSEFINVGGYRLHLRVHTPAGVTKSRPVIVLESGGGSDSSQWADLQAELATETDTIVVAYDRSGYGDSDLPAAPYDIRKEVEGLHTALTELSLADEIVLVGHSYGGLQIQLYAAMWPDTVLGLLFLDPNAPAGMILFSDILSQPPRESESQSKTERAGARMIAALFDTMVTVYQSPIPEQIPIIVVSAERGLFPTERQNRAFRLIHELLAVSVIDGKLIIADGSDHNVPGTRPDIVIEAARELVDQATRR